MLPAALCAMHAVTAAATAFPCSTVSECVATPMWHIPGAHYAPGANSHRRVFTAAVDCAGATGTLRTVSVPLCKTLCQPIEKLISPATELARVPSRECPCTGRARLSPHRLWICANPDGPDPVAPRALLSVGQARTPSCHRLAATSGCRRSARSPAACSRRAPPTNPPRATGVRNKDEAAHHWAAILAQHGAHTAKPESA